MHLDSIMQIRSGMDEFRTIGSIWERAQPTGTSKAASVQFQPTRIVKNLFDNDLSSAQDIINEGVNYTKLPTGFTLSMDGTRPVGWNCWIAFRLPISDDDSVWGKTLTVSFRFTDTIPDAITAVRLGYFRTSHALYTIKDIWPSEGDNHFTLTLPATKPDDYMQYPDYWGRSGICLYINPQVYDVGGTNVSTLTDIQVEYGGSVTAYYPYFSPTKVLSSLKAFGGIPVKHKAPKLWGKFIPTEYITFDGSSYLDLAPLTTESEIEITFRKTATSTAFIFGTNPDGSNSPMVGSWVSATSIVVQNGIYARATSAIDTDWHTLKVTSAKTYLDGVELGNAGERSYFQDLIVGSAYQPRSTSVDTRGFRGDISRVKVGNKIFVAGKDVVANTFGLIDPAENKFYGNAGTGTITGGALIQPISGTSSTPAPSENDILVAWG